MGERWLAAGSLRRKEARDTCGS